MNSISENTGKKQDGKFVKGQSGNPSGHPKGSLNNTTKMAMALLDEEVEAIAKTAIALALNGDIQAIRLILERTIPLRKERSIDLALPAINTVADIMDANKHVINAVATGNLTTSEGHNILALLENLRKAIETRELEQRINALEVNHAKS